VEELGRAGAATGYIIGRMRIARWLTKAADILGICRRMR
jgi:hypothetical protein